LDELADEGERLKIANQRAIDGGTKSFSLFLCCNCLEKIKKGKENE
jgi:hypothetical protein